MDFLFDVDETLVCGDVIEEASKILLKEKKIDRIYTNKDTLNWELNGLPEILIEKTYNLFENKDYAVWNKKMIVGTTNFIRYLHMCGFKIGLLTARPIKLKNDTINFFNLKFPEIFNENNIFLTDNIGFKRGSKKYYLEKLKPKYFFDDNPQYCKESFDLGINTFLISNKHTPWNHGHSEKIGCNTLRNVSFFEFK